LLRSVTFYPYGPYIDSVYWTLPIEVSFYALVALALAMEQSQRLELSAWVFGVGLSLLWIVKALSYGAPVGVALHVLVESEAQLLLVSHGMHFALGIVLCAAAAHGWTGMRAVVAMICGAAGAIQIVAFVSSGTQCSQWSCAAAPVVLWGAAVALLAISALVE